MENEKKGSGAKWVAAGILLSRSAGLVRERVFAHYFGNSDAGDAFKAALKIPNFLQNLFGEGVLSASFIPVYAQLLAKKDQAAAGRLAGVIAGLLALVTSIAVALGILATPVLIDWIAPGFQGPKRELTIRLVQILFPGTGLLVWSAWCLGVLNSHRRFFLSYAAPVAWNLAIIAALVWGGARVGPGKEGSAALAVYAAWGLVLGSLLQILVQLPTALRLVPELRLFLDARFESARKVIASFFPVVLARGVVQISAYIDNVLASLLPTGAVSALAYAQVLYLLPVSLFGMSVSAAELPAMSSARGDPEEIARFLRAKLDQGLRQIAFFIIPSVVAFLVLGDLVIGALFQTGAFDRESTLYVWGVLAGSTVGLLAATLGRLYASAFYSLQDTRTPLRFALVRVVLVSSLGALCGLWLPQALGWPMRWGAAGLTASAGVAGWVEFFLLRRSLNRRIGWTGLPLPLLLRLWGSALLASLPAGLGSFWFGDHLHPILKAGALLLPYGILYFAFTAAMEVPESRRVTSKVLRKLWR